MSSVKVSYNGNDFTVSNEDISIVENLIYNCDISQMSFSITKSCESLIFCGKDEDYKTIQKMLNSENKGNYVNWLNDDDYNDDIEIDNLYSLEKHQYLNKVEENIELSDSIKEILGNLSYEILDAFNLSFFDDIILKDLLNMFEFFKSTFEISSPNPTQTELNFEEGTK